MGCNYCEIWRDARIAGRPEWHGPIGFHRTSIAEMFGKVNTKCQSKIVQLFGNKNVEGIRNLF